MTFKKFLVALCLPISAFFAFVGVLQVKDHFTGYAITSFVIGGLFFIIWFRKRS